MHRTNIIQYFSKRTDNYNTRSYVDQFKLLTLKCLLNSCALTYDIDYTVFAFNETCFQMCSIALCGSANNCTEYASMSACFFYAKTVERFNSYVYTAVSCNIC